MVEGRADVLNLLKHGIKNAIAVEGTSIPETIIKLSKERIVTAFTDGDRGGELILKELLQVADVDYVARAPEGKEVEELTKKEIVKALRSKVPAEQVITEMFYKGKNFYDIVREREKEKSIERTEKKTEETREERRIPEISKIVPKYSSPREIERFSKFIERLKEEKEPTALFIGEDNSVLGSVPVRELTSSLKNFQKAYAIVFNGVITQRLIDLVSETGVRYLVGARKYNVVRRPVNLKILTFAE